MTLEALRARHRAGQIADQELERLPDDQLRVLALDEALAGRWVAGYWPPALATWRKRRGRC